MNAAFALVGLFMVGCAWDQWQRSRGSAVFWLLLGTLFAFGSFLPNRVSGLLLLAMVLIDAAGWVKPGERTEPAAEMSPGVAWPVFTIALVLMATGLLGPRLGLDATQAAVCGLALGSLAGAALALYLTGDTLRQLLRCGSALNQTIGSVSILPQLLASLGAVLAAAHLGPKLAGWLGPLAGTSLFGAVVMTCLAMSGLSALTGNSFAAYPVAAGGILVPLLLQKTGADPSALAVWTLTVGACGTLVTPMAANFNLVPAALLDLPDPYGVLKKQWPFGVAMWTGHVLWMWLFVSVL
jgi:uncharacterized membrane protein